MSPTPLQIPIERRSTGALNTVVENCDYRRKSLFISETLYDLCSLVLWLIGNHVSVPMTLSVLERRNAKRHIFRRSSVTTLVPVWPKATKFGTITQVWRGVFLKGPATPPVLIRTFVHSRTIWERVIKFFMVIKLDDSIILQGWPRPCRGHNFYDMNADARFVSSSTTLLALPPSHRVCFHPCLSVCLLTELFKNWIVSNNL